ncbi:MAG: hypothetical protein NZ555_17285, partial [Geminicoccaceae bacterium]|nr:hypothetical protein [Geminicoccaceae bacterium]
MLDAEDARALLAELAGAGGEALAAEVARLKQRAVLPEEALAAAASPAGPGGAQEHRRDAQRGPPHQPGGFGG